MKNKKNKGHLGLKCITRIITNSTELNSTQYNPLLDDFKLFLVSVFLFLLYLFTDALALLLRNVTKFERRVNYWPTTKKKTTMSIPTGN